MTGRFGGNQSIESCDNVRQCLLRLCGNNDDFYVILLVNHAEGGVKLMAFCMPGSLSVVPYNEDCI